MIVAIRILTAARIAPSEDTPIDSKGLYVLSNLNAISVIVKVIYVRYIKIYLYYYYVLLSTYISTYQHMYLLRCI